MASFSHTVDFPTMIRRFDLMQADILAALPAELKSAVRTGFLDQTETKISGTSFFGRVQSTFYTVTRARKLKRKVLKTKNIMRLR